MHDQRQPTWKRRETRGAVLLLVLLVVAGLSVVVTAGLRGLRIEDTGARTLRNRLRGEAMAESGLRLAAYWLARGAEASRFVHYGQTWSRFFEDDQARQSLVDPDTASGAAILNLFADEKLRVEIQDESGKLPINALAGANFETYKNILLALLQSAPFHMQEPQAMDLIYAIRDWLDADGTPFASSAYDRISGAEDDYYQDRQAPYRCKNGPMESLSELLLIRGVTRQLYTGENGGLGLKDLLTVWESRAINIGTAPAPILRALAWRASEQQGQAFATAILAYRENPLHYESLQKTDWYRTALPEFKDLALPEEVLTLESSHFTVRATARIGSTTVQRFACLERARPEAKQDGKRVVKVLLQRMIEPSPVR